MGSKHSIHILHPFPFQVILHCCQENLMLVWFDCFFIFLHYKANIEHFTAGSVLNADHCISGGYYFTVQFAHFFNRYILYYRS